MRRSSITEGDHAASPVWRPQRRPIVGRLAGMFVGIFLGTLLRPALPGSAEDPAFLAALGAGFVIGALLGLWRPLARRRAEDPDALDVAVRAARGKMPRHLAAAQAGAPLLLISLTLGRSATRPPDDRVDIR